MRIGILGPLEVRDDQGRPVPVSGPRLRALLVRLALDPGRAVSADRLLDDLWEGAPPAGGGNALQALVSRLRSATGAALVEFGPAGYRLALDPAAVDAVAFERAVTAARAEPDPAARSAALRRALGLWRGPALADVEGAGFAAAPAARLGELRLSAAEDQMDAALAAGGGPALVPELEALTAAHPLRERPRGLLMRALYAAGRPADALRLYDDTRRELADRLGVDPSPELAAVHLAVLRRDPALTAPEPPAPEPPPPAGPRTNLPAQFTSFVGREEEGEQVRKLVREHRLVTLTGPGGAGKTRLAAEAAAPLVPETPDGVWFVPLAPLGRDDDVAAAVLAALGLVEPVRRLDGRHATAAADRLLDALAGQAPVIVLDNCEHLVEAAAVLAGRLLQAAPGVRVLATSREPLGITGESLCPVPSLPLPPAGAAPEDALRYASVRLFADRAAAVRPGFAVDAATAPHAVRIVRELDGIPLAIELAAARLRSLTVTQVAGRLGDRFRLLTAGSRTALPRHRTLRAVVDWSWDLLDDTERTVLRRLSVFSGGAAADAAAAVCGLPPVDPGDVEDVLAALVDKSLVMADGDTDVRYRLLETVRAYTGERLDEANETPRVRAAHAAFLIDLAERAEPELRDRDQLRWADRLFAERDNCTAAFRHILDTRDAAAGLRLVGALAWFWFMRDQEREAGGWAVAVNEIAGDTAPAGLEEQYALSRFTGRIVSEMTSDPGPSPEAMRAAITDVLRTVPANPRHPALVLARPIAELFVTDLPAARRELAALDGHPDPWVRAATHIFDAYLAINEGDIASAARLVELGAGGFTEIGDRWGMIVGLNARMRLAVIHGDLDAAIRLGEEAHRYAVDNISPEQSSMLLVQLAEIRAHEGDTARAREDLRKAVAQAERIGEFGDLANALVALSDIDRRAGDLAAARPLLELAHERVLPRRHRADVIGAAARTFGRLGLLAEQEGDLDAATRWHTEALESFGHEGMVDNPALAGLVTGLAAYAAASGDHERAAELVGAVDGLNGYRDRLNWDLARAEDTARNALGEDAFAAAHDRGRTITREDALALRP
ncbi:tetratricopeptide repeat protein [Actinomadura sp. PM05-2]|uniref:Tetratricopeptide repeat protein n=1 Tax=Actinomadura parmotrematis TaxID=2864039 RepID=A0ABS7FUF9_9ACTN|nr:tetratricopeptide repeat protein [Actinomadura parmotrematis]